MLSLGVFSFTAPWALVGLAALPALWWLLRVTPPAPSRIVFPPLALLAALSSRENAAARTPWWLLVLRLMLATALILGIARPVLNPTAPLSGSGPVLVLIDNGWAAADRWQERMTALDRIIDRAEGELRLVVLVPTAPGVRELPFPPPSAVPARVAREAAHALAPLPWASDRSAAVSLLIERSHAEAWKAGAVFWLSDGLAPAADAEPANALLERLRRLGAVTVITPRTERLPLLLASVTTAARGMQVDVARPAETARAQTVLRMIADDGAPLARQPLQFDAASRRVTAGIDLPAELEGRLARIEIEGESSAGAVLLVDERWRRRAVGIVGESASEVSPLLAGRYYLERALQPFAEVRIGSVQELLGRPLSMLVLIDVGTQDADTAAALRQWVEHGGVLLRFAGPRLAREASRDDALLPVALRAGERTIGGALSWENLGTLAAFSPSSPFHDLPIPQDLRVERQVIAEPALDTAERTWASMADGTPLVTGARRGEGWVVLVHTTASPEWSNLPLSGLFVEFLHRISDLARSSTDTAPTALLPPLEILDGYGRLGSPPATARAIAGEAAGTAVPGPRNPPGFYGTPEAKRALNLGPSVGTIAALGSLPAWVQSESLDERSRHELRTALLVLALLLAVLDLAISLGMRGFLWPPTRRISRRAAGAVLGLALIAASPQDGSAQTIVRDGTSETATLTTRLAWIRSGDSRTDAVSAAGLSGLSAVVNRRTAAELGAPVGIDPNLDELAFYPLIYWPLVGNLAPLSPAAIRKLGDYMRSGGTIVFDTGARQDADRSTLQAMAHALDLPPLAPVAEDHVLRRSYYLLEDLPGRRAGGTVWVERSSAHINDGVSAVIAGSADWAGAWAMDEAQRPMLSVSPGGERQREHAYRFGVNLVMYVLTGNYKADQVHLPTILERLAP